MSLIFRNIFWLTFSRVVALVLLFLAYAQLFRYLGPFGSGQYQFVLSYVMIFSVVVDFGISQFITKKMSEDPPNVLKYFRNFFVFELFLALVVYAVLLGIAYFKGYENVLIQAIAVTGLGMFVNALCYPFLCVLTAKQDLKKVAFINFLNSFVNISIIFAAIYFKKYIVFLAFIQVIFGILDLFLYRFFVKKHLPELKLLKSLKALDFTLIKSLLISAWPFALLVGFSAIYNRVDVLIITSYLGFAQTGLYTAAYKFFDLLNFFPASVSHTLFPFLTELMSQNKIAEVKATLEKYLKLMAFAALPVAVGGTVLSKPLILLVAGEEYLSAAPILQILIWAVAILFIYIPVNSLVISQLTKKAVWVTGANVLVNIVGNILLVPKYGIKAAAVMTVVSEFIQGFFYFYFVKSNITRFSFFSLVYKPVLASAVMGVFLYKVINQSLFVLLPAGFLVYVVMLLVLGFVKKEDFSFFKNIFRNS